MQVTLDMCELCQQATLTLLFGLKWDLRTYASHTGHVWIMTTSHTDLAVWTEVGIEDICKSHWACVDYDYKPH